MRVCVNILPPHTKEIMNIIEIEYIWLMNFELNFQITDCKYSSASYSRMTILYNSMYLLIKYCLRSKENIAENDSGRSNNKNICNTKLIVTKKMNNRPTEGRK